MKRLLSVILGFFAFPLIAANHCVGPAATGAGTGADWNNQMTLPGSPIRGDNYYLAAGYYGSSYTFNSSGTTPILIQKATIASHGIATGWLNSYASGPCVWANPTGPGANGTVWSIGGGGFVTFDGQTGSIGLDTNNNYGFIIAITNTATLPSGGGNYCFHVQQSGPNVNFQSIWFQGPQRSFGLNVPIESVESLADNIYITNCFWSDVATAVQYVSGANGGLYEHNYLYRGGSGNAANHSEFFAFQGGCNNVTIRFNTFNTMCGDNGSTAYIADTFQGSGTRSVYGNVIGHLTASAYTTGQTFTEGAPNGAITTTGGGGGSPTWNVYNNTVYAMNSSLGCLYIAAGTMNATNNIFQSCNQGIGAGNILAGNNIVNTPTVQFLNSGNGDFRLAADTSAWTPLGAPFNVDPNGVTRTSSLGAYQYVGNNPFITVQPQSVTILAGANATFSVVASGTAPLTYQWKLNGVNIATATTSSFTTNAVPVGASGNAYSVGVTNSFGGVLSASAIMTVNSGGNNALTNIYVSPIGSVTNTGATTNSPWDMATAMSHLQDSNTVFVMDGDYFPGNCPANNTITNYFVTIKAINKWRPRFRDLSSDGTGGVFRTLTTGGDGLTIDGLQFSNIQSSPILARKVGTTNMTVRNCWTHHTGFTWAGSQNQAGIQMYAGTGYLIEDNLSEFNGLNDVAFNHGVYFGGTNCIIRNNVLRNNGGYGIYNTSHAFGPDVGNRIYNNLIYHNNSGNGLTIDDQVSLSADTQQAAAFTNWFYCNTVLSRGSYAIICQWETRQFTNNIIISTNDGIHRFGTEPINADYNLATQTLGFSGPHDVVSSTANFVNTNNGLYWLVSTSPARGVALAGVFGAVDWFGNAQASVTDIGAYQFVAGLTTDSRVLDPSPVGGADYWTNIQSGGVAPTITTQPVGTNIQVGQSFTLSVVPAGTPPFNYQWKNGSTVVQNGTIQNYTKPNAQTNDTGTYTVIITNVFGTVTSSSVSVNVTNPVLPSALIAINPQSLNFGLVATNVPTLLSFNVQNVGAANLSFTASVGAGPYSIISGGTNTVLNPVGIQPVTVQYLPTTQSLLTPDTNTITITNITSGGQTNVSLTGIAYTIQNPTNINLLAATILYGFVSSTTGTVYQPFTGLHPLSTNEGVMYAGFTLPNSWTNAAPYEYSESTNTANNSIWFNIDQFPTDPQNICTFTNINGGGLQLNPMTWNGATNVFNLSAGPHVMEIVGRAANCVLSTITILQQSQTYPVPPLITAQPASPQYIPSGGPMAPFSVTATGTLPLAYQWYFNSTPIAGANQTSFAWVYPLPPNSGLYSCLVTNSVGSVQSFGATLVVTDAVPGHVKVHIHH